MLKMFIKLFVFLAILKSKRRPGQRTCPKMIIVSQKNLKIFNENTEADYMESNFLFQIIQNNKQIFLNITNFTCFS